MTATGALQPVAGDAAYGRRCPQPTVEAAQTIDRVRPIKFFRTQQHRFGNGHIIAPQSRFLPDDMMPLFTRTVASMATLASDDLGLQAPVSIDIGAQLRGMWS